MNNNHVPVMLNEVLSFIPKEKKINLIDATFGGGGYSKAILTDFNIKKLILLMQRLVEGDIQKQYFKILISKI